MTPQTPVTDADSVFIRACRRQEVSHTPVWVMRQAGVCDTSWRRQARMNTESASVTGV